MADFIPDPDQLPAGPDRADGVDSAHGTPTAAGQVIQNDSGGNADIEIQELPDSPEVEVSEQETWVHRWNMSYDEAMNRKEYYPRGAILFDNNGDIYRALSCSVKPNKGRASAVRFTVSSESLSANLPPDQFEINPVELGINIIKYPRYFYAFNDTDPDNALLNQSVIRVLQNYFENPPSQYRDALTLQLSVSMGNPGTVASGVAIPHADLTVDFATGLVSKRPTIPGTVTPICGTDIAKAAAMEIIQKYWRNEETPYIVGWEITWYSYYYTPQILNPGGYVENPISDAVPQLPDDFWDITDPSVPYADIFAAFIDYNPQCYMDNNGNGAISWLRKADHIDQTQRTWIKIRRQWLGTPIGFWDEDLYSQNERPSTAAGYSTTTAPTMAIVDVNKANCIGVKAK
jgi:hypothetical protein